MAAWMEEPMHIRELTTPCALVDVDVVRANTHRMRQRIEQLGSRLRPHVKTHKCVEAALLQCGGTPGPITVSTLAEAEHYAAAGFTDITYAVPIAPARLPDVHRLSQGPCVVSILLDSWDAFHAVEQYGQEHSIQLPVFLKVDCGYHRAGVDPTSANALQLAAALSGSAQVLFRGLLTHAGHAYDCSSRAEILPIAEQERSVIVSFAERLRQAGIAVPAVSLGSTPTASVVEDLSGVTEVRPGNYAFFDCFQAKIGVCSLQDVAFSVLSTVIGVYRERETVIVDAGALALSKDAGAVHVAPDAGYGICLDPRTQAPREDWALYDLSQEHGKISMSGDWSLSVGDRIRILPNHSCLASALHAEYHVVKGDTVIDHWQPVRGW